MTDSAPSSAAQHDDPAEAVWQEYPVSLFGDAMRSVTVLLGAVAGGCGLAFLLDVAIQFAFAPTLSQWIPAADVEAVGIAAMLVSLLTVGLALASPAIPGLLAQRSLNNALLTAVRAQAPKSRVPHPVQQGGGLTGIRGAAGLPMSALAVFVAGIYLLIRIIIDPSESQFWLYGAIALGYGLLCVATTMLISAANRRALAQFPRQGRKKKDTKRRPNVVDLFRKQWPKAYRNAVWSKAAQSAGYDSIREARKVVKEAADEESRKHSSTLRAPQLGGGRAPLPTKPGVNEPEWALRDQPPGLWRAIRTRWGAMLATWAALLGALFLGRILFGHDDPEAGAGGTAVAAVMGVALLAGVVTLLAEMAVAVIRTRERAQLFSAAADPGSSRPAEGALARCSAARRLGLARAGALLVGMALPFVIAALEATGDEGSWFVAHADAVRMALWACIGVFAMCVIVQTVEYHFGRSARNGVMARWPSLWHGKDLTGW